MREIRTSYRWNRSAVSWPALATSIVFAVAPVGAVFIDAPGIVVGLLAVPAVVAFLIVMSSIYRPRRKLMIDYDAAVVVNANPSDAFALCAGGCSAVLGSRSTATAQNGISVLARTGWETDRALSHRVTMVVTQQSDGSQIEIHSCIDSDLTESDEQTERRLSDVRRLLEWFQGQPSFQRVVAQSRDAGAHTPVGDIPEHWPRREYVPRDERLLL